MNFAGKPAGREAASRRRGGLKSTPRYGPRCLRFPSPRASSPFPHPRSRIGFIAGQGFKQARDARLKPPARGGKLGAEAVVKVTVERQQSFRGGWIHAAIIMGIMPAYDFYR